MMRYTYKKKLFGGKLLDEQGRELEFNKKELRLKTSGDGFVFDGKKEGKTQELIAMTPVEGSLYRGEAFDRTGCLVDVESGKVTEPFLDYSRGFIASVNGKLKTVDKNLKVKDTGYTAVTTPSRYANHEVLSTLSIRNFGNEYAIAQNKEGKFGVVSKKGVVCPFVFDSPEIQVLESFQSLNDLRTVIFTCKGREVVANHQGELVADRPYIGEYDQVYHGYDNHHRHYAVYDKKANKTILHDYNNINGEIEPFAEVDGRVTDSYSRDINTIAYKNKRNDKFGLVDKDGNVLLEHKYDSISEPRMKVDGDIVLKLGVSTGKKDERGATVWKETLYSMAKAKEIKIPEVDEIDYELSGTGHDGLLKFFAKKNGYWGVVNENGKVEVDFNYRHSTSYKYFTYRRPKREDGSYDYFGGLIEELRLEDKDGNECYFNIGEKNIIASEEEMEDVAAYDNALAESAARDRKRKADREAKAKAEKAKREAEDRRAEREEQSTAAAIGATLLTGSPIAGMIVKGMMDDDGPSMD